MRRSKKEKRKEGEGEGEYIQHIWVPQDVHQLRRDPRPVPSLILPRNQHLFNLDDPFQVVLGPVVQTLLVELGVDGVFGFHLLVVGHEAHHFGDVSGGLLEGG